MVLLTPVRWFGLVSVYLIWKYNFLNIVIISDLWDRKWIFSHTNAKYWSSYRTINPILQPHCHSAFSPVLQLLWPQCSKCILSLPSLAMLVLQKHHSEEHVKNPSMAHGLVQICWSRTLNSTECGRLESHLWQMSFASRVLIKLLFPVFLCSQFTV